MGDVRGPIRPGARQSGISDPLKLAPTWKSRGSNDGEDQWRVYPSPVRNARSRRSERSFASPSSAANSIAKCPW
jgi:hypothetical protein